MINLKNSGWIEKNKFRDQVAKIKQKCESLLNADNKIKGKLNESQFIPLLNDN